MTNGSPVVWSPMLPTFMAPDLAQGVSHAIADAEATANRLAVSNSVSRALVASPRRRWRSAAVATVLARALGAVRQ